MASVNLKGLGGRASGILSGVAAVATVVAAILGILSQLGLISGHDTPKTVALTSTSGAPPVSRSRGAAGGGAGEAAAG